MVTDTPAMNLRSLAGFIAEEDDVMYVLSQSPACL